MKWRVYYDPSSKLQTDNDLANKEFFSFFWRTTQLD